MGHTAAATFAFAFSPAPLDALLRVLLTVLLRVLLGVPLCREGAALPCCAPGVEGFSLSEAFSGLVLCAPDCFDHHLSPLPASCLLYLRPVLGRG